MAIISPSILSADFSNLRCDIETIKDDCEYIHIDIMDGIFVPNISFGMPVQKALRPYFTNVFDTHLMIEYPLNYIEQFVKAGSDIITFHVEAKNDPLEVINKIHSFGVKAGISVKPGTDIHVLDELLKDVELVLVMSVEPGFGGQKFNPICLEKIKYLSEMKKLHGYNYEIEVDGGINEDTAKLVKEAGCEVLVAGSYVFNAPDRKKAIDNIR